jgi:broad specificity phosphatase PhoE
MTRIVLIRHALPRIDPAMRAADWPLSSEGVAAAAQLAGRLESFGFAEIASSPELKAVETASAIAQHLGVPMRIDDGFAEHHRASAGFLPREAFEDGIRRLFRQPAEAVFGDETADAAYQRFVASIDRHRLANAVGDLAVVTHGTVLTLYACRTTPLPEPFAFWKSLRLPDAIVIENGRLSRLF